MQIYDRLNKRVIETSPQGKVSASVAKMMLRYNGYSETNKTGRYLTIEDAKKYRFLENVSEDHTEKPDVAPVEEVDQPKNDVKVEDSDKKPDVVPVEEVELTKDEVKVEQPDNEEATGGITEATAGDPVDTTTASPQPTRRRRRKQ